jgi:hypothetical protein
LSDVSRVPDATWELLDSAGKIELLVIGAHTHTACTHVPLLTYALLTHADYLDWERAHNTHFSLPQALECARKINPVRVCLCSIFWCVGLLSVCWCVKFVC